MTEEKRTHRIYGCSHQGMLRTNNEDSFYVDGGLNFMIVADGMGGAAAGEVASGLAVRAVSDVLSGSGGTFSRDILMAAVAKANKKVFEEAADGQKTGMGCTLVVFAARGSEFMACHVGDSRLYLYRGRKIYQLTRDHSYVNELVERGVITAEEAAAHPERNVITRCVGTRQSVEADFIFNGLREGDIYLACSDGLTNELSDEDISAILGSASEERAAAELVDMANMNGGRDNITVTLFYCGHIDGAERADTLEVPVVKPCSTARGGSIISVGKDKILNFEALADGFNYYLEKALQFGSENRLVLLITAAALISGIVIGILITSSGTRPETADKKTESTRQAGTDEVETGRSQQQNEYETAAAENNKSPFDRVVTKIEEVKGIDPNKYAPAKSPKENKSSPFSYGKLEELIIDETFPLKAKAGQKLSLDKFIKAKVLYSDVGRIMKTESVDVKELFIECLENKQISSARGEIEIPRLIRESSVKLKLTFSSERGKVSNTLILYIEPSIYSINPFTKEVEFENKKKVEISELFYTKMSNSTQTPIDSSFCNYFKCSYGTVELEIETGKIYYKNGKFPDRLSCEYNGRKTEIIIKNKKGEKNRKVKKVIEKPKDFSEDNNNAGELKNIKND